MKGTNICYLFICLFVCLFVCIFVYIFVDVLNNLLFIQDNEMIGSAYIYFRSDCLDLETEFV